MVLAVVMMIVGGDGGDDNDGDQGVGAHLGFSVVFLELRRSGGVAKEWRSDEAE